MSLPRVSYADCWSAVMLGRRLYVPTAEAAELLGLTPRGAACPPLLIIARWRAALAAAEAVDRARLRARVTLAAAAADSP